MANLNDIFANDGEQLSDDELLKYLHSEIPEIEKHAIEQKIMLSPFESDAAEGLQQMKDAQYVQQNVAHLNKNLRKQLRSKKKQHQLSDKTQQWIILAVILILFICISTYGILRLLHQ